MENEFDVSFTIHNCHTHIFTIDYIPRYFVSRFVPTTVIRSREKEVSGVAMWVYKTFRKRFTQYAAFLYSSVKGSQEEVLLELMGYYPSGTKFAVLSVDFDYMMAGKPILDFEAQLKDLAALKRRPEYRDILLPFICADPRRPGVTDLVKRYIEEHGFCGIKLYPSLGFFPTDERLKPVFQYAEQNNIPITSHCIPVNKNYYKGKLTGDILDLAADYFNRSQFKKAEISNYEFARYFNHPYWYRKLIEEFPRLKINLAHFGGNVEWNRYLDEPVDRMAKQKEYEKNWYSQIRDLLKADNQVYADISFTVHDNKLYPLLKHLLNTPVVQDKVLFGSDFYMLQKDYRERRFGIEMRGYIGEEGFHRIASTNAKRFLSIPDLQG